MRELLVVLHREFVERVRSRSFILSTILTPLLLLLVGLGPMLFSRMQSGGVYQIVIADETAAGIGESVAALLRSGAAGAEEDRFAVEVVESPAAAVRDSLAARVRREQIDGLLLLPPQVEGEGRAEVLSGGALSGSIRRRLDAAVSTAVQARRLQRTGLTPGELAAVLRPVPLNVSVLTAEGSAGRSEAGLAFSFLVSFFLYMLILLYGTQVMQSVQEEKTNRIAEVLVSSIRAQHLMLGKVLGVGLAALLQVAVWVAFGAVVLSQRDRLHFLGLPDAALSPLLHGAGASTLGAVLAYMLLGFFLYASLFAAVGAAAETTEDAQRFTFPLIMPLILPMLMGEAIISAPRGTAALVLSWVPLTTPLVMPMRMGAGGATSLEVASSVAYLALSVAALGWFAGKVYRVGILSTGKRASWADVVRWVRMN